MDTSDMMHNSIHFHTHPFKMRLQHKLAESEKKKREKENKKKQLLISSHFGKFRDSS